MKKTIFLLIAILFAGCTPKLSCLLAQFPPQIVYAGAGCTAPLPNYVTRATVVGGCTGFTVVQTPVPGTILTATNKVINVVLKATGTNGKTSQISFTVTLADTITPKITGLTAIQIQDTILKKANALYDVADNMTETLYKLADRSYPWDLYPGSGPSTQGSYDSSLFVTVSMKDLTSPAKEWKRFSTLAKNIAINPDTINTGNTGQISWSRLTDVPANVTNAVNYYDWYDWNAYSDYTAIPKRNTASVDLTKVKTPSEFVALRFNKLTSKLEFLDNNAWHQITSN